MKLSRLVNTSTKLRKLNSKLVQIKVYKEGRKNGYAVAAAKTFTPYVTNGKTKRRSTDKKPYVSSVMFIDKKLNVKVSCSCPDYTYRWEVPNHNVGASDVLYSNGEPASTTNPAGQPGLCKHLIALALEIRARHPSTKL